MTGPVPTVTVDASNRLHSTRVRLERNPWLLHERISPYSVRAICLLAARNALMRPRFAYSIPSFLMR
jgi:hypothetical protein